MTDLHRIVLILVSVSLLTFLNAYGFSERIHFFPNTFPAYNCPSDSLEITVQSDVLCARSPIELQANLTSTNLTWNYGDGVTNNGLANGHASHVYLAPGDYTITATADYGNNCQETSSIDIRVLSSKVDFDYQVVNNTLTLTAKPTDYTSVDKYLWTLGDGATASGLTPNFEYTYRNPGVYMVTLVGEGACTTSPVTKTIVVGTPLSPEDTPSACADGIDNDGDGFMDCEDSECECICTSGNFGCCDDFTAKVNIIHATPGLSDGAIEIIPSGGSGKFEFYEIDWGDLSTDDLFSVDNLPAGMYNVTLHDTAYGCSLPLNVEVEGDECRTNIISPNLTITSGSCMGGTGIATATPSGGNGPYTYLWSNGSTAREATNLDISLHSVTIMDATGCSVMETFMMTSENAPVSANFSYEMTADSIVFEDLSTGPIINHQWTFNTPDLLLDNRVPLPPAGAYSICLIVSNSCGGTDTNCKNISIAPVCAEGNIEISIDNERDQYCSREPIVFSTNVTAEKYTWYFGELNDFTGEEVMAEGSQLQDITQVYFREGKQTVKLVVDYGNNCIDSTSLDLMIRSSEADFTYSLDKNIATFIADSTDAITDYYWTVQGPDTIFTHSGRILKFELKKAGEYLVGLLTTGACNAIVKQKIININRIIVPENSALLCSDGIDNDGDGLLDCEDTDCPCPICPTDLVLNSQIQVDNFPISYPECTVIEGNVTIQSVDDTINNLTALQQLTYVGGDLLVFENPSLQTLNGLDNIVEIGGDIEVDLNPLLINLAPLNRVEIIGETLAIGEMIGLNDLFGSGSALTFIGHDFLLYGPTQLNNLSSLENVVTIGGTLEISNQTTLSSLTGLTNLTEIGGAILINDNDKLSSLSTLSALTKMNGEMVITTNPALASLEGLDQIDPLSISRLVIQSSTNLSTCNVNSICTFIENGGITKISGNAVGCTSVGEIQALCSPTPPANTLFSDYPWLLGIVDTSNCKGVSIQEFASTSNQTFIYLNGDSGSGVLYNKEGTTWCSSAPNFDCLSFYTVVENLRSWSCHTIPLEDEDGDGSPVGEDPDDTDPCVPDQNAATCPDTPPVGTTPSFFDDFPWLLDIVDPSNCMGEKITIYSSSGYIYVFVETESSSTLYNHQGIYYCQNGVGLNCLDYYRIDEVLDEWICEEDPPTQIDADMDGTFSGLDPDDNDPCVPDNSVANCNDNPVVERPTVFIDYPWLTSYIDPTDCNMDSITVYRSSGYIYLFVQTKSSSILYNAEGVQYCVSQANFNCQDFYAVDEIINTWSCQNSPVEPTLTDEDGDGVTSEEDPDDTDPCVPNAVGSDCGETSPTSAIFDNFPFLTDIINPADCQDNSILHYKSFGYDYFLVVTTSNPDGVLYNGSGVTYCSSTPTYDCTEFYAIDEVIENWSCGTSTTTEVSGDCSANTGNIRLTNCSDGTPFFFIEMPNGTIYDPYFAEGFTFEYYDGQTVNFDFVWADFLSPCNFVQGTIVLTCIEESADCYCPDTNLPVCGVDGNTYSSACEATCAGVAVATDSECGTNTPNFFIDFPWLADLIDVNNCSTEKITVYKTGAYNYIWIETPEWTAMYFEDGTFYCQQTESFDCLEYYQLDEVQYAWTCSSGLVDKAAHSRSNDTSNDSSMADYVFEITVYPNPSTGVFAINLQPLKNPTWIRITDSKGHLVKEFNNYNNSFPSRLGIDLSTSSKGIYFIQILDGDAVHSERLLIH